jgi:hypothetical protein
MSKVSFSNAVLSGHRRLGSRRRGGTGIVTRPSSWAMTDSTVVIVTGIHCAIRGARRGHKFGDGLKYASDASDPGPRQPRNA